MIDIIIIGIVSVFCVGIAYYLYMKKELKGQNLGTTSGNGNGEGFYGKKLVREDGSYVATKWFMILLVPILPLIKNRLVASYSDLFSRICDSCIFGLLYLSVVLV
jgi:hypothetical protein